MNRNEKRIAAGAEGVKTRVVRHCYRCRLSGSPKFVLMVPFLASTPLRETFPFVRSLLDLATSANGLSLYLASKATPCLQRRARRTNLLRLNKPVDRRSNSTGMMRDTLADFPRSIESWWRLATTAVRTWIAKTQWWVVSADCLIMCRREPAFATSARPGCITKPAAFGSTKAHRRARHAKAVRLT